MALIKIRDGQSSLSDCCDAIAYASSRIRALSKALRAMEDCDEDRHAMAVIGECIERDGEEISEAIEMAEILIEKEKSPRRPETKIVP